jgi:hypothetical protein
MTRLDCVQFMSKYTDVYPILFSGHSFQKEAINTRRKAVIEFVLEKFPEPNDNTSWEQIFEFRKDENLQRKYYNLIGWVNRVAANTAYDKIAIVDEYNELLSEYQKAFELHQKISATTRIGLIVKSVVEIFTKPSPESVGSLVNNMFSLHQRNFELMESESKVSGKELAYIHHALKKFSNRM